MFAQFIWQGPGWYGERQEGSHETQRIVAYRIATFNEYGPDGMYQGKDLDAPYYIWDVKAGLGTPFAVWFNPTAGG